MTIAKKEKKNYLYGGIALVVGGTIMMLYLVETRGPAGDFVTAFGKVSSLIAIIMGIVYLVRYDRFYQEKSVELDIQNDILVFEDESYPLEGCFLTLQMQTTPKKDMYRLTLFLEKKSDKAKRIFENIVFDVKEMAEFLKLIKPYRKTKVCLVSEKPYKIQLFQGGFTYEGREILYNEVEQFDTTLVDIGGDAYLDIEILV